MFFLGNLTDYLKKRGGKLPENDALVILKQILRGYYEMLKLGIVHRDLKPDNIFLNNQTFKIGDFGFAKTVHNFSKELMTSAVGTPLYMAPQILTQSEYSTKSDLWSIALIYYEMLTGISKNYRKFKKMIILYILFKKIIQFFRLHY